MKKEGDRMNERARRNEEMVKEAQKMGNAGGEKREEGGWTEKEEGGSVKKPVSDRFACKGPFKQTGVVL